MPQANEIAVLTKEQIKELVPEFESTRKAECDKVTRPPAREMRRQQSIDKASRCMQ